MRWRGRDPVYKAAGSTSLALRIFLFSRRPSAEVCDTAATALSLPQSPPLSPHARAREPKRQPWPRSGARRGGAMPAPPPRPRAVAPRRRRGRLVGRATLGTAVATRARARPCGAKYATALRGAVARWRQPPTLSMVGGLRCDPAAPRSCRRRAWLCPCPPPRVSRAHHSEVCVSDKEGGDRLDVRRGGVATCRS